MTDHVESLNDDHSGMPNRQRRRLLLRGCAAAAGAFFSGLTVADAFTQIGRHRHGEPINLRHAYDHIAYVDINGASTAAHPAVVHLIQQSALLATAAPRLSWRGRVAR